MEGEHRLVPRGEDPAGNRGQVNAEMGNIGPYDLGPSTGQGLIVAPRIVRFNQEVLP
jgi:hypothetical protein